MTDKDRWLNVAQAAQWLGEGREVEWRRPSPFDAVWRDYGHPLTPALRTDFEYRLKPEPPKEGRPHIEVNDADVKAVTRVIFDHNKGNVIRAALEAYAMRLRERLE